MSTGAPGKILNHPKCRLCLLLVLGIILMWRVWPRAPTFRPLDRVPKEVGGGRLGCAHGQEIVCRRDREVLNDLLARVPAMKPSLPEWYLAELSACARAAGVDEGELLLAQCEGDIWQVDSPARDRSPDRPGTSDRRSPSAACSAHVVFGKPNLANGSLLAGRNLDYYGGELVYHCALTTYYAPRKGDGYPFTAVGFTGILGGATLVNSRGLVVANHLGGGARTNPAGVPSLVLNRLIAQKCATIDEALKLLRKTPRRRGQIVWMAQPADEETGREARAVAVEFDAEDLCVREAEDGILLVSNVNYCFRQGLEYAVESGLDYYRTYFHPWSVYRFDRSARTLDLLLGHAVQIGMKATSCTAYYRQLAGRVGTRSRTAPAKGPSPTRATLSRSHERQASGRLLRPSAWRLGLRSHRPVATSAKRVDACYH